jgi:hypothetical protein
VSADGWDTIDNEDTVTAINEEVEEDEEEEEEDLERGSGGKGIAAAVLTADPEQSSTSTSDRMMQAVQAQRDRFMKVAREKETEATGLKNQLERVQSEQMQLKNDNLELYQRLRLLRAQSRNVAGGAGIGGDIEGGGGFSSSSSGARSRYRKDNKGGGGGDGFPVAGSDATGFYGEENIGDDDAVDKKYMRMYEDKIDPFKLEELDRQSVLSRMNIFERGLASITRFSLQDQWARHALMFYLLLVHCFALGYVMQVLNPQLIEEVDAHLKAQWSTETLDLDMNREHPDIR